MLEMMDASHGQSLSPWAEEAFTSELTAALLENDPALRQAAMLQAEQTMLANWPLLPVAFETSAFVTRKTYQGLSVFPFGPVLDFSAPEAAA